jgi:Homing endonuclease associated repeat
MPVGPQKRRRPPTSFPFQEPEALVAYLRDLASRLKKPTLTRHDIQRDGRIHIGSIIRRYGSFSNMLVKAGLRPSRAYKRDPNAMLQGLQALVLRLGGHPTKMEIKTSLPYSPRHYEAEFGSIARACELAASLSAGPSTSSAPIPSPSPFEPVLTQTKARRRYGPILDFRGLRHAPINEQGVVFLFGMLAAELGFVVESIQDGFPDCDAKLRRKDGTFEGVRLEFEFRSSEFQRHGHDPAGCDFIVCWEHNWPECPIPVIDLSAEVQHRSSKDVSPNAIC